MKEEKGGNTKRSQSKILPSKRINSEISERNRSSRTKSMQLNRAVARVQKAMVTTSIFLGKKVISIDQLREDIAGIELASDDLSILKKFSRYAKLFHPALSSIFAHDDPDVWRKVDVSEIQNYLRPLGLSVAAMEFEIEKFKLFKDHTEKTLPSEIEFILETELPKSAAETLQAHGIFSLHDARRRLFSELKSFFTGPWANQLRALTLFSFVTSDITLSRQFYKNGLQSIHQIANLSKKQFEEFATIDKQDPNVLNEIRVRAQQVQRRLTSAFTSVYINADPIRDNNMGGSLFHKEYLNDKRFQPDDGDQGCGNACNECEDATSPFAYLLDLIAFSTHHYGLGLVELENNLHRNLPNLQVICHTLDQKVPILLICTEILERFIIVSDKQISNLAELHTELISTQQTDFLLFNDRFFSALSQFMGMNSVSFGRYIDLIEKDTKITKFDRDRLEKTDLTLITGISTSESKELWKELHHKGFIDKSGRVTRKFKPESRGFSLSIRGIGNDQEAEIINFLEVTNGNALLSLAVNISSYTTIVSPITVSDVRKQLIAFRNQVISVRDQHEFVLAIKTRQAVAKWLREDSLINANEYNPEQLAARRRLEIEQLSQTVDKYIETAFYGVLTPYYNALLYKAKKVSNSTTEELEKKLLLSCAGNTCDEMTRLEEATFALRFFIESLIIDQTDTERPIEDIEWRQYENHETWRGLQLKKFYPELFYNLERDMDVLKNLFSVNGNGAFSPARLVHFSGVMDEIEQGEYDNAPNDVTTEYTRVMLEIIDYTTKNLAPQTYANPDEIRLLLNILHKMVWRVLPVNQGIVGDDVFGPAHAEEQRIRAWNQAILNRARDPEKIASIPLCDWLQLQGEVASSQNFLEEMSSSSSHYMEYAKRHDGFENPIYILSTARFHLIAFYILPRLWGKFYSRIREHDHAARCFHLIYNENINDYPIAIRVAYELFDIVDPINQVIYQHLRRYNSHPSANDYNRYDVEIKDMKLLIGANYLDWADQEFRKNTEAGRAQAIQLYQRVLKVFGADGDCRNQCDHIKQKLDSKFHKELGSQFKGKIQTQWTRLKQSCLNYGHLEHLQDQIQEVLEEEPYQDIAATNIHDLVDKTLVHPNSQPVMKYIERGEIFNNQAFESFAGPILTDLQIGCDENIPGLGGMLNSLEIDPQNDLPSPGFDNPIDPPLGNGSFDCIIDGYLGHPTEDLVDIPEPDEPQSLGGVGMGSIVCPVNPMPISASISHGLCVPQNPRVLSLVKRSCLGLQLIRECRNILGYRNEFVPLFRYSYLIEQARHFAGLAINAEKDFISFSQAKESEVLNLLKESQSLHIAQGTVALNRTMLIQASDQVDLAILQQERVEIQQTQVQDQLEEGATDLEEVAIEHLESAIDWQRLAIALNLAGAGSALAGGAIGGAVGVTAGPAGGLGGAALGAILAGPGALSSLAGAASGQANIESTQAQIAQIQNSIQQRLDELERNGELLEKDAEIAAGNIEQAGLGVFIAQQQLAITHIQLNFARDIVHFLRYKNFNYQRWAWMADIARENYRLLLNYSITAAWLAERALEFERQTEINFIRFDYWKDKDEGILGIDELSTDMAKLEHEKLINEKRKKQLSKTISLASIAPIELAKFRETGQLFLATLEEWFERDFPTHYLRLVKGVTVYIAALVPPTEGIKASLTQLGTTRTLIKRTGNFEVIEIKRPPENIAISSPVGATGTFTPLIPESGLLNPFEGNGVAGSWELAMPKSSNPLLNYDTIIDVQLVILYTALEDPLKQPVFPLIAQASATYSAKLNFPDSYYHLHNPDFFSSTRNNSIDKPPYRVQFIIDSKILAPNQGSRKLSSISLFLEQFNNDRKRPITTLRFRPLDSDESAFAYVWKNRITPENGLFRVQQPDEGDVTGIYELSFVNDETIWDSVIPQVQLPLPVDFDFSLIETFNMFKWLPDSDNNYLEAAKTNGQNIIDLSWLKDIIFMLEYEYLTL